MKVLLLTGRAGVIQGWGDMTTTERICDAINTTHHQADILYISNLNDLENGLAIKEFDIIWSSLYYVSDNSNYVGLSSNEPWIADILDKKDIPYIGPTANALKNLIDKSVTHKLLSRDNFPLPSQYKVNTGTILKDINYPAFVKPCFESESTGINEQSVVHSNSELADRIEYIHNFFLQPALVEEYLPGREFTVAVVNNGYERQAYVVENIIEPSAYKKYPLVTIDLKVKDLISFKIPYDNCDKAQTLALTAANTLECYDHIRVDMREDSRGMLKIIEVNGIPGLNPVKSRSLQIHSLYNPDLSKDDNFELLISTIVNSALERYRIFSLV